MSFACAFKSNRSTQDCLHQDLSGRLKTTMNFFSSNLTNFPDRIQRENFKGRPLSSEFQIHEGTNSNQLLKTDISLVVKGLVYGSFLIMVCIVNPQDEQGCHGPISICQPLDFTSQLKYTRRSYRKCKTYHSGRRLDSQRLKELQLRVRFRLESHIHEECLQSLLPKLTGALNVQYGEIVAEERKIL